MNREELINLLDANNIDKSSYDFNDGHSYFDDQYLLNQEGKEWVIYYLERGKKLKVKSFSSEDKANKYFLGLLLKN